MLKLVAFRTKLARSFTREIYLTDYIAAAYFVKRSNVSAATAKLIYAYMIPIGTIITRNWSLTIELRFEGCCIMYTICQVCNSLT